MFTSTNGTLCCAWCGHDLNGATNITYLNGNQPICDLCLLRAKSGETPIERDWNTPEEDLAWRDL